jgi:hypothetical protein
MGLAGLMLDAQWSFNRLSLIDGLPAHLAHPRPFNRKTLHSLINCPPDAILSELDWHSRNLSRAAGLQKPITQVPQAHVPGTSDPGGKWCHNLLLGSIAVGTRKSGEVTAGVEVTDATQGSHQRCRAVCIPGGSDAQDARFTEARPKDLRAR